MKEGPVLPHSGDDRMKIFRIVYALTWVSSMGIVNFDPSNTSLGRVVGQIIPLILFVPLFYFLLSLSINKEVEKLGPCENFKQQLFLLVNRSARDAVVLGVIVNIVAFVLRMLFIG